MGMGTGTARVQSNGSTSRDQMNAEIFSLTSREMTSSRHVSFLTAILPEEVFRGSYSISSVGWLYPCRNWMSMMLSTAWVWMTAARSRV